MLTTVSQWDYHVLIKQSHQIYTHISISIINTETKFYIKDKTFINSFKY